MYLRHTTVRKNGKVRRYWRLVQSVRVGRRVKQQTVAHLGELDEDGRIEARALARRPAGAPEQAPLFDDGHAHEAAAVPMSFALAPSSTAATPTTTTAVADCITEEANDKVTLRRQVSLFASRYDAITALPWPGPAAWKTP